MGHPLFSRACVAGSDIFCDHVTHPTPPELGIYFVIEDLPECGHVVEPQLSFAGCLG